MEQQHIWNLILEERERQDKKWGMMPRNISHSEWLGILVEEVGEAAEANNKQNGNALIGELVQVMAVGVSWLEDKF